MMDIDSSTYTKRVRLLSVTFVAFLIVFIFLCFAISNHISKRSANIVNYSTAKTGSDNMSKIRKAVYDFLKVSGYNPNAEVTIRESSIYYIEGRIQAIVDIDEIKQTYQVYVDDLNETEVTCVSPELTKYPDSFCVGSGDEYDDSINSVLGAILPYEGKSESGSIYSLNRESADRNLYVRAYVCEGDKDAIGSITDSVRNLIKTRGGNPDSFNLVFEYNNCK